MEINPRFAEYDGEGFSLTTRQRRMYIERIFGGDYPPMPLVESLREAGVREHESIGDFCLEQAVKVFPHYPTKAGKMSFIYAFDFDFAIPEGFRENPYFIINNALTSGRPVDILRSGHLIYGLLTALRSLPYIHFDVLYRGLKVPVRWEKDDVRCFAAFTSFSRSLRIAEKFLRFGDDGKSKGTLITAKDMCGYDIRDYSMFVDEEPVIIEPLTLAVVVETEREDDLVKVTVAESGNSKPVLLDKIPINKE